MSIEFISRKHFVIEFLILFPYSFLPLQLCTHMRYFDKYVIESFEISFLSITDILYSGKTPLHHSADKGHIEVVKYLVDHGAHVSGEHR